MFLSSHLLAEVEQLCNRVAVIGRGHLLAEGTLAEVVQGANGHLNYRLVVGNRQKALRVLARSSPGIEASIPTESADGLDRTLGEEIQLSVGPEGVSPVVRELVTGGVEVQALVPVQPNLEDLFLESTKRSEA